MKKISVKQLLVNAMEEYGNNLILSDHFKFILIIPRRIPAKFKKQHTQFGGI